MASLTGKTLEVIVVIIAVALLFPIAGKLIFNANTVGWDSTSKTVFPYVFLIGLVAIVIGLLYRFLSHRGGKGDG